MFDGGQLDGRSVAADHDQFFGLELLHPFGKTTRTHSANHDQQFVLLARVQGVLKFAAEDFANLLQARRHGSGL